MRRAGWFALGILCCGAGVLLAAAVVLHNARGFPANHKPGAIEALVARWARSESFPGDARQQSNPAPNSPEVLEEARAHWADHCATCHANDGSGDTEMGKNTYPPAPDMRLPATQRLTDGELFYIIQNGVRFTAMPAWGGGGEHGALDSWKLVRFIRHLPQVTEEEKRAMEKLNPKTPAEMKEEQEEEKFLEGEDRNGTQQHHHH